MGLFLLFIYSSHVGRFCVLDDVSAACCLAPRRRRDLSLAACTGVSGIFSVPTALAARKAPFFSFGIMKPSSAIPAVVAVYLHL